MSSQRTANSFEVLEDRTTPATLYVLTHGLQINSSTVPAHITALAEAINRWEKLGYSSSQTEKSVVSNVASTATAPGGAADFQLFNWAADSGFLHPCTADDDGVAGKLAQFVRERFPATGTLDLHLIGHSRGAYVNLATISSPAAATTPAGESSVAPRELSLAPAY